MLKKTVLVLSFVALCLSMTMSPTLAQAQAKGKPAMTISEYEVLKHLQTLTDEELLAEGYTEEQVKEVREIDYAAHIRKISKLDEKVLRKVGYTDDQINLMQKFDGSEEQMGILAAYLALYAGYEDWHYETNPANNSWVKMWVSWGWAGIPAATLTDKLVLTWSHDFRLDRDQSVTYADVNYYYETAYGYWDTQKAYPTADNSAPGTDTSAAEFQIVMRKGIGGVWCVALDGSCKVRVSDPGPEDSINLFVSYGHRSSILALNPGWSIISGGDVSIDWGGYWTHNDVDAGNLNIYTGVVN